MARRLDHGCTQEYKLNRANTYEMCHAVRRSMQYEGKLEIHVKVAAGFYGNKYGTTRSILIVSSYGIYHLRPTEYYTYIYTCINNANV